MTMAEPFFIKNREKLFSNLKDNSVAVLFAGKAPVKRGDEYYPFSPDRNFYYVSGIDRENCILLFTKRAEHLAHQPGDISFPGGRKEKNETPLETALRETQEELGILPEQITLLGKTDFMLTTSGALINPFVGYVSNITIEEISFNKDEVAEIFTVPLSFFRQTQPEVHFLYLSPFTEDTFPYDRITGGKNYPFVRPKIPELFYQYKQYTIWGITAQIAHHAVCLFFQEEDKK